MDIEATTIELNNELNVLLEQFHQGKITKEKFEEIAKGKILVARHRLGLPSTYYTSNGLAF